MRRKRRRITGFAYLIPAAAAVVLIWSQIYPKPKEISRSAVPAVLVATETVAETLAPSQSKETVRIENVPHIYQSNDYPTGCESVAATVLMQYYDVNISVEEFIDNHLPKADYPYYEDDVMYGENPWDAFIGDPYSSSGYGCYSTAIVKGMQSALDERYEIRALYNVPLEQLCKEFVDAGHPVLIWATMGMKEPYEGRSWILPNGETFTFLCPEHALVLIGYDAEQYYFSDSQSKEAVVSYPKTETETAYEAMQRQAIVMMPLE